MEQGDGIRADYRLKSKVVFHRNLHILTAIVGEDVGFDVRNRGDSPDIRKYSTVMWTTSILSTLFPHNRTPSWLPLDALFTRFRPTSPDISPHFHTLYYY